MKIKRLIKTAAAILTGVLLSCLPVMGVYAADTSVTYAGRAAEFVFIPDSTDLFDNFKDVVPGDTRFQKITVRNTANTTVEIFLRANAVESRFEEFLREINLSVTVEPNSKWYDAPAADMGTEGMTANRSLGFFRPGADLDITVNLSVPVTWSNQFQGGYGEMVWVFTVIEYDPVIPPIIPPVIPPVIPPPVIPPTPVTTAPPETEPVYNYDILKPVPETEALAAETVPETEIPATEPEIVIIEDGRVPLGSAGTEAPLLPDDVPSTGDRQEMILWCVGAVALTLVLSVLIYLKKRIADEDGK